MSTQSDRIAELQRAGTALQAAIDALSNLESMDSFIPQVLHIVAGAFGASSAGYFEHPERTIYLRYWLFEGQVVGPAELPGLSGDLYDLLARMAQGFTVGTDHLGVDHIHRTSASIVHHAVATATPEHHDFCRVMGWDWELNVPLVVRGRAEGALTLFRPEAAPFSPADVALAEELAKYIALAMKVSRLAQRERELTLLREKELVMHQRAAALRRANRALRQSTAQLVSSDNLPHFLDVVLQEAIAAAGAVSGAVFLHRPREQVLTVASMVLRGELIDIRVDPRGGIWRTPIPTPGFLPWTILSEHREAWHVDYADPRHGDFPPAAAWHREAGHRFVVCVPMVEGERAIGFFGLCFDKSVETPPDDHHLELSHALAQQATLAVRMAALSEESRRGAVLEERARLAREIHDGIAQTFIGIRMQLGAVTAAPARAAVDKAMKLVAQGLTEVRRAVQALRPWQLLNRRFEVALGDLAAETLGAAVHVDLRHSGCWDAVPPDLESQLFRIVQELLNNIAKHARASKVTIELSASDAARSILITDDGQGFDPAHTNPDAGFGLLSIQQRAAAIGAQLEMASRPGRGTQVLIEMAVPASPA